METAQKPTSDSTVHIIGAHTPQMGYAFRVQQNGAQRFESVTCCYGNSSELTAGGGDGGLRVGGRAAGDDGAAGDAGDGAGRRAVLAHGARPTHLLTVDGLDAEAGTADCNTDKNLGLGSLCTALRRRKMQTQT